MMPLRYRAGGIALMETVVSAFLLGGVILALFNIYPVSAMSIERGEQTLRAEHLISNTLDQIQTLAWKDIRSKRFDKLWGEKLPPAQVQDGVQYLVKKIEVEDYEMTDPETGDKIKTDDSVLSRVRLTVEWTYRGKVRIVVRDVLLHRI